MASPSPSLSDDTVTLHFSSSAYFAAIFGASALVTLLLIVNIVLGIALVRRIKNSRAQDAQSATVSQHSFGACNEKNPFIEPVDPNYTFPPKPPKTGFIPKQFIIKVPEASQQPTTPCILRTSTSTTQEIRFGRPTSPMQVLASTGLRSPTPSFNAATARRPSRTYSHSSRTGNIRKSSLANSLLLLPPRPDDVPAFSPFDIEVIPTARLQLLKTDGSCNGISSNDGGIRRTSDATLNNNNYLQMKPTRLSIQDNSRYPALPAKMSRSNTTITSGTTPSLSAPSFMMPAPGVSLSHAKPSPAAILPHPQRVAYSPRPSVGGYSDRSSEYGMGKYDDEITASGNQEEDGEEELEEEENEFMKGRERHLSVYTSDSI